MNNIKKQFPELVSVNESVWNQIYKEILFYQRISAYVLLDLQQSYRICWQIQMTKRCAQILLKYESTAISELYGTGILDETEYSYILGLIEKKLFHLEFYRVRMPKGEMKVIEDAFESLPFFRSLSQNDKARWQMTMRANYSWFQPGDILLEKGQVVSTAYIIARGIVECKVDEVSTYFRSGNIVGIDGLFWRKFKIHGTYSASSGLVAAYRIDASLLNQLLKHDDLASSFYHEIALHSLCNHNYKYLQLDRAQIKLLLEERAKFFKNPGNILIRVQQNERLRLFLLDGHITDLSNGQKIKHKAIGLKMFDGPVDIQLDPSTVTYTWTENDEKYCPMHKNLQAYSPIQDFCSIFTDLFYPKYSNEIDETSRQRRRRSIRQIGHLNGIRETPSTTETEYNDRF